MGYSENNRCMPKRYELFLFDLDDTLFDFQKCERASLRALLEDLKVEGDFEAHRLQFSTINQRLWDLYAHGKITKDFLRPERFRRFFNCYGWDFDAEKAAEDYIEKLSESCFLIDHALELLTHVKTLGKIGIVTNGIATVQDRKMKKTGLDKFVDFVAVSENCGFAKPHQGIFESALSLAGHADKATTLMVGDRLEFDIHGANLFGITSVWANLASAPNPTQIIPHHEVKHLREIYSIIGDA